MNTPEYSRRSPFATMLALLGAAVLLLTFTPAAVASVHPVAAGTSVAVVHVDGGFVHGITGNPVTSYLGIPYAAPPTGALRWRAPQPVPGWPGIKDATQFAPSCPQPLTDNPFLPPGAISEDCLHLNVYAPTRRHDLGNASPVLVWIHGGGLVQDAARNYDGAKLAAEGIVVVTIDYRLGALGYLAHPALAVRASGPTGNFGLMDQQAALRWVARNVGAFGGDPTAVTIAGQSAGGLSVLAHLVSRGSHGLFRRAIVQSGAFGLHQHSLAEAEASGEQFADAVGCADDTAACLRRAPVSELVDNFGVEIPGYVDGVVLTESIDAALAAGRFNRVPVLNGTVHDEERLFIAALGIAVSGGTNVKVPYRPITADNYQDNIAAVLGVDGGAAAAVAAEYPPASYSSADVALSTLVSDANFACPALQVDRWTSLRVPTFAYQFNDDTAPFVLAPPGYFPAVATHDSELPYLFDQPNTPFPSTLNSQQQMLAGTMRAAWTAFVTRGNPSTRGLAWPMFRPGAPVMSLALPSSAAGTGFASTHHCGFWSAG